MKKQKILLRDKLILALYVGCKGLSTRTTSEKLADTGNSFLRKYQTDESVQIIILPDPNLEPPGHRIECINPRYLSEEEQSNLTTSLGKFLNVINQYDQAGSKEK